MKNESISFVVLAIAILCAAGCRNEPPGEPSETGESVTQAGDLAWRWTISPIVPDLSTDVGDSPIGVTLRHRWDSTRPEPGLLEEVARRLEVLNASGDVLPAEAVINVPDYFAPTSPEEAEGVESVDVLASVTLAPKAEWAREWHTLRLSGVPDLVRPVGFRSKEADANFGPYESRFTPHSRPVYQSIVICHPDDKPVTVIVTTSQPVLHSNLASRLTLLVDGKVCATAVSADAELGARVLVLGCQQGAVDPARLELTLSEALIAHDQSEVSLFDGRVVFTVVWPSQDWLERDGVCAEWLQ